MNRLDRFDLMGIELFDPFFSQGLSEDRVDQLRERTIFSFSPFKNSQIRNAG
jgi:hypothetical protein